MPFSHLGFPGFVFALLWLAPPPPSHALPESYVLDDSVATGGNHITVFENTVYVLGNGLTKWSLDLAPLGGWPVVGGRSVSANGQYVCIGYAFGIGVKWYSTDGTLLAASNAGRDGLAMDISGRTIARAADGESLLVELTPEGATVRHWFSHDRYEDDHFKELDFVPSGSLYATVYFDGDARTSVREVLLDPGGDGRFWRGSTTQGGCSGPANNQPAVSGLGVDPAGNVYAVDGCDNAVEKHGPSGALLARWTREESITDVAADAAGNVYVLTSSHIWKYAPDVSTATPSASWGQIKARWSNR